MVFVGLSDVKAKVKKVHPKTAHEGQELYSLALQRLTTT
jgi:hypothetical protein